MKCKLCKRNKALLKAKVGKATIEVCLYCVISEGLEPTEVLNVWETQEQERLEERNQRGTEL
jgi:ribosome-binding protein aMBF1 (putative translation factor)